jgi:putative flippase GtrA
MTPEPATPASTAPATGGLALVRRLWNSWATRSLAVGAVATVIDIALGTVLLTVAHLGASLSAMAGTALGALFGYFANRSYAFRDHDQQTNRSAVRYFLVTGLSILLHGWLVGWLRDVLGVPFVAAKMASDLVVFSFLNLLLMRYLVFPRRQDVVEALGLGAPAEGAPADPAP